MTQGGTHGRLGRGISFGNALDSARDEVPGLRLKARYFDEVRDAGFDTVRLPVRWSAHAEMTTTMSSKPRPVSTRPAS